MAYSLCCEDAALVRVCVYITVVRRLCGMGFFESGWFIGNGEVTIPSNIDPIRAWHFVQEAIYDGHLPVVRAIGYSLNTPSKANIVKSNGNVLNRFQNCAEDRMSLVASFSNLLFIVPATAKRVRVDEHVGVLLASKAVFTESAKPVTVLSTRENLMTALETVSVDLAVHTSTGYVSADENYRRIQQRNPHIAKTRMFPMYSYHNIIDFVSVIPYTGDGKIHLRYKHGMTDSILMNMFVDMFNDCSDKEWAGQYEEVLC